MVDVPTRTLLDYLNSLPSGGVGGAVTRDLTIRDDLATGQQAVPPGGSAGEVLVKLSGDDFNTGWSPAGTGTVQTVSIDTANGLAGSSDGDPSNPTLTLSTTVTGILEGNGTAIAAATATGTGNVVRATSPTLVTPALGTPSSATLTNATGLPISTGVSGLGTGVATFLSTPTSANLAAAVTGETGTGALVFATSPTLVTPNIGAATGASLAVTGALSTSAGVLTVSGTSTSTIAGPLNIAGAAAGQIVFPAIQNPSSNANTLDDYEEGTFTPTLQFGGAAVGMAFSLQFGSYTKIGRLCFVNIALTLTAKGSSTGIATIPVSSLPFTPSSTTSFGPGRALSMSGLTGAVSAFTSGPSVLLVQSGATGNGSITDAEFTNSSAIGFSGCYQV